ncbi:hypothetical protein V6N11_033814 [Hibiscus sabdariffa]|uniref:Uncharacterized protein n=1 Tax=Hibiscus sabdariffa TaxID=183260 RepID=A0ABR2S0T9_9ROSI
MAIDTIKGSRGVDPTKEVIGPQSILGLGFNFGSTKVLEPHVEESVLLEEESSTTKTTIELVEGDEPYEFRLLFMTNVDYFRLCQQVGNAGNTKSLTQLMSRGEKLPSLGKLEIMNNKSLQTYVCAMTSGTLWTLK